VTVAQPTGLALKLTITLEVGLSWMNAT